MIATPFVYLFNYGVPRHVYVVRASSFTLVSPTSGAAALPKQSSFQEKSRGRESWRKQPTDLLSTCFNSHNGNKTSMLVAFTKSQNFKQAKKRLLKQNRSPEGQSRGDILGICSFTIIQNQMWRPHRQGPRFRWTRQNMPCLLAARLFKESRKSLCSVPIHNILLPQGPNWNGGKKACCASTLG